MIVQAALVSSVWFGGVAWLDLPWSMAAYGVPVAVLLAWRDHRHDAERDEFEHDDEAGLERDRELAQAAPP